MPLSKPPVTGSSHPLSFEKLSPLDFERLCLWLVRREGFERAEHLGEAGSEGGRDVGAWKDGRRFVFQCKRVQAFTAAHAKKEIEKLRKLPAGEQPQELVFVVTRAVSAEARSAVRAEWGDEETCHFWAGSELDERVKRYPDLVRQFFQLSASTSRFLWGGVCLSSLGMLLALAAWLWPRSPESPPIPARPAIPETWIRGRVLDESNRILSGARITRQDGVPGNAITDAEGRFALKLALPRDQRVRLRAEHLGFLPEDQFCPAGSDACVIIMEEQ